MDNLFFLFQKKNYLVVHEFDTKHLEETFDRVRKGVKESAKGVEGAYELRMQRV